MRFDDDAATMWGAQVTTNDPNRYVEIQFSGGAAFGVRGVRVTQTTRNFPSSPAAAFASAFRVEARNDATFQWKTLFTVTNETGQAAGETREYIWEDDGQKYDRIRWYPTANNGSSYWTVGALNYYLTGVPATLTWDNADGINNGQGFVDPGDIGRPLRYLAADGVWRQVNITNILQQDPDPPQISGTQEGFWNDGGTTPVVGWQLGAFSATAGWPATITLYQERLVFGGARSAPRSVFFSKTADYNNFGLSDPLQDDDGVTIDLSGQRQDGIAWVREMSRSLIIGTSDDIKAISGTPNNPFSATNFFITDLSQAGTLIGTRACEDWALAPVCWRAWCPHS